MSSDVTRAGKRSLPRPRQPAPAPEARLSLLRLHLAWSGLVLAFAVIVTALEFTTACPPGGPLAVAGCDARPAVAGWLVLSALLYVIALTVVLRWAGRRAGQAAAVRDWYLLAAGAGLLIAPLTAFSVLAAFGWLG
jgi:hypothetical protein